MNDLNAQIQSKISRISFSNGKPLKDYVSTLVIKDRDVGFSIDITGMHLSEGEDVRQKAECAIAEIHDIGKISISLTSTRENLAKNSSAKVKHYINNVCNIILVAAGKGGVGKSTIAVALAESLQKAGKNVGLVDADIYGPSIPQMFGINKMPEIVENKMIPHKVRGLQINSIGFLTKGEAVAWRGPMTSKAIYQLLSVTAWDNLDYLIIDMPPGTGDIHLSILENYHVSGAVIVTTPQKISQIDVEKAIELYKKFNLPIFGIIENMSYFIDPATSSHIKIFEGDSGSHLAKKYNTKLIAQLPIIPEIAATCDEGKPLSSLVDIPLTSFLRL